jgi:hypothetical protein
MASRAFDYFDSLQSKNTRHVHPSFTVKRDQPMIPASFRVIWVEKHKKVAMPFKIRYKRGAGEDPKRQLFFEWQQITSSKSRGGR